MRKFLLLSLLVISIFLIPAPKANAQPSLQEATAQEVINAVNALRVANGLHPLNTHPALMEVAQWEANAIAAGAPGHVRPPGLTLGQWLISLGYPLAGDLSLDGYRSENWVAARTVDEAIQFWLGDGPHTNTMLSPDRSDIGAAVAISDQIYIVLETALQTNSGDMQTDAVSLLTALPYDSTGNLVSDYILPVIVSTARPDGDVIHKVAYGQSLWSIAMAYNITIAQIRVWNGLGETDSVYEGEILLVQKAATQPVDTPVPQLASATSTFILLPTTPTATLHPTVMPTASSTDLAESETGQSDSTRVWVMLIIVFALIGGAWLAMSIRTLD
ncbi:MAG: LysM peptidoglycan-binding domain-containing protein [Anaerolineae bacterium]|jgi:uncharacterized protein YkwD/LysM repeat protein|nr:LysM peptidoglycan-binding domain-containing protein [Anaerolineae bacterium]MBT7072476.1 LysM peptidoglycan-binding domain-containing protein [Anaerolineae bacterium]MBT7325707.1 LysM peptidoglycan-binding domain-containing protein [Anaerolineae bacterium]